jgi:two-component system response regulator FlrC
MPEKKDVVLVIDDTAVRNALQFVLEVVGFNVWPYDGLTATLASVAANRCCCIVLDDHISTVDAVRLLQDLRIHAVAVPVIMLTARLDRKAHDRSTKAGIHRMLELPILDRSLLEAVLAACG